MILGVSAINNKYKMRKVLWILSPLLYLFFSDHNEHAIPLHVFVDAQVLPIKFFYYESIANLMFDVQNRTAPSNIQDLFQDMSNVHFYNTHSSASNNFYTKPSRLTVQAIPSLE